MITIELLKRESFGDGSCDATYGINSETVTCRVDNFSVDPISVLTYVLDKKNIGYCVEQNNEKLYPWKVKRIFINTEDKKYIIILLQTIMIDRCIPNVSAPERRGWPRFVNGVYNIPLDEAVSISEQLLPFPATLEEQEEALKKQKEGKIIHLEYTPSYVYRLRQHSIVRACGNCYSLHTDDPKVNTLIKK